MIRVNHIFEDIGQKLFKNLRHFFKFALQGEEVTSISKKVELLVFVCMVVDDDINENFFL